MGMKKAVCLSVHLYSLGFTMQKYPKMQTAMPQEHAFAVSSALPAVSSGHGEASRGPTAHAMPSMQEAVAKDCRLYKERSVTRAYFLSQQRINHSSL